MRIDEPILTSILDTDLYKLTTAAVVFHNFPHAWAEYKFINRANRPFPVGFDEELKRQISMMQFLYLHEREIAWINNELTYLPPTFLEWFKNYRFNPSEVEVSQDEGVLSIRIYGPWFRSIFWEVPLMAVISELYFRLTKHHMAANWENRIVRKATNLGGVCHWIEFGTRRRYSFQVQDRVVDVMRDYQGFLGTSNPYLAMKYGVPCQGTYPHEAIMAMYGLFGSVKMANRRWLTVWRDYFGNALNAALPDTFTTEVFLADFSDFASSFKTLRQDSGNPRVWMDKKIIPYFDRLGVSLKDRTITFSDNLTDSSYKKLELRYNKITNVRGGIGTYFTNDVGATPINMVIKLSGIKANNTEKLEPVVKLSDDVGKHSGDADTLNRVQKEVDIITKEYYASQKEILTAPKEAGTVKYSTAVNLATQQVPVEAYSRFLPDPKAQNNKAVKTP